MNPTAGADTAASYRQEVLDGLARYFPSSTTELLHTASADDPTRIGHEASGDLILCLSGDGTVHGVLQGVMKRPRALRPALCVLPLGSGNDIAKTFSIPASPSEALPALAEGYLQKTDVGSCLCDGQRQTYYLETLSFGVDAAVALKTIELRKRTRQTGTLLYARAAIDAIFHELHTNHFRFTIDGEAFDDELLILAVQNGPTYGGGFKVAPRAVVDDGLLNVCRATRVNKITALYYLSRMKGGAHEHLKAFTICEAKELTLELDRFIPVQIDGEPLPALRYEISIVPNAVDFLSPRF